MLTKPNNAKQTKQCQTNKTIKLPTKTLPTYNKTMLTKPIMQTKPNNAALTNNANQTKQCKPNQTMLTKPNNVNRTK